MSLDYEIRNDPVDNPDNLDDATRAVNELRTGVEEFRSQLDQRLADQNRALGDRLAALETRLNRPVPAAPRNSDETTLEQRAFHSFLRYGVERMDNVEARALSVSTDTAGGYLTTPQFLREIDRNLVLFSPVRSIARVQQVGTQQVLLPKRTGRLTAAWVPENGASSATQPSYGQTPFNMDELVCHVDVSNRLLEDAQFNLEAELAFDLAEEFGRAEGAAFVAGDGVNKPLGFLNDTNIGAGVTTASPTAIVADELIDLYHALPTAYAARAVWGMNRTTIGQVRKMKTSTGEYLWHDNSGAEASLPFGNAPTILGRPVVELPDMPDPAASATPIIFGDFMSGFRIFDRVSLSILRDPYSQQTNGLVRFHARRRVGGGVSKSEALKFLKMHA